MIHILAENPNLSQALLRTNSCEQAEHEHKISFPAIDKSDQSVSFLRILLPVVKVLTEMNLVLTSQVV